MGPSRCLFVSLLRGSPGGTGQVLALVWQRAGNPWLSLLGGEMVVAAGCPVALSSACLTFSLLLGGPGEPGKFVQSSLGRVHPGGLLCAVAQGGTNPSPARRRASPIPVAPWHLFQARCRRLHRPCCWGRRALSTWGELPAGAAPDPRRQDPPWAPCAPSPGAAESMRPPTAPRTESPAFHALV